MIEMAAYRLGPLLLVTAIALPELPHVHGPAPAPRWSFRVSRRRAGRARNVRWLHEWAFPSGAPWVKIGRVGREYLVRFHRTASFRIDVGERAIVAFPRAQVPARTIRHLLLNQIAPMIIGDADHLALHASAVASAVGAVAFLGPSGSGKSTLAAALARAGDRLVTDDCLVVDLTRRPALVIPTSAGLRLWPDALSALFPHRAGRTAQVAHYSPKQRLLPRPSARGHARRPVLLRAACVLAASGASFHVERLQGHRAFAAVLGCTFHLDVDRRSTSSRALERVAAFVESVPVFRLYVPRDLTRVSEIGTVIRAILAEGHASSTAGT